MPNLWDQLFSGSDSQSQSHDQRLARLERKVQRIAQQLGIDLSDLDPPPLSDTAKSLADQGQKIAAIKSHREATGASLAEAKQIVELYLAGRGR
jgi:ferritin-like metal-binding protein YciE